MYYYNSYYMRWGSVSLRNLLFFVSKADIVLGLDNNLMAEAKKTGLLTEHNVDTANTVLPNGWSDTTFVPYDYGYFAFVYNTEKLANPPKSPQVACTLVIDTNAILLFCCCPSTTSALCVTVVAFSMVSSCTRLSSCFMEA